MFPPNYLRDVHKTPRELPWRLDPWPYEVWILEMMLQQTYVEMLLPYFKCLPAAGDPT